MSHPVVVTSNVVASTVGTDGNSTNATAAVVVPAVAPAVNVKTNEVSDAVNPVESSDENTIPIPTELDKPVVGKSFLDDDDELPEFDD